MGEWEQGRQYGQQEEKEESAYFTFPGYPQKNRKHLRQGPGTIRLFVLKNGVCCRFVMFHDTSCQSLQCSCLSVFKVAIIAFFNSTSLHSQGDDSDIELVGVECYSPYPASFDEPEDEGTTLPQRLPGISDRLWQKKISPYIYTTTF